MTDRASGLDGSTPDAAGTPVSSETSPATGEPAGAGSEHGDEIRSLRAEAARRRQAQRAAETERDTLRGRVDRQDRREIERLVGDRLQNAEDFWLTVKLDDLRDDDGDVDVDRVGERVQQLLSEKPHWAKSQAPPPNFSSGVRQPLKRQSSLGDAFKNALTGR